MQKYVHQSRHCAKKDKIVRTIRQKRLEKQESTFRGLTSNRLPVSQLAILHTFRKKECIENKEVKKKARAQSLAKMPNQASS